MSEYVCSFFKSIQFAKLFANTLRGGSESKVNLFSLANKFRVGLDMCACTSVCLLMVNIGCTNKLSVLKLIALKNMPCTLISNAILVTNNFDTGVCTL